MRKCLFLALFLAAGGPQDKSLLDVFVDAPTTLSPGSAASLRVAVLDSKSFTKSDPVAGAEVEVLLARARVFAGKTDGQGTLSVSFQVTDLPAGTHPLRVEVKHGGATSAHEQGVSVRREQKILLVTDKPLYQPGQTIRIRALALEEMTLLASRGAELVFEVDDAKGNKVFRRSCRSSEFGVASVDFELADEVNMGDFKIAAQMGESKAEKTVTVKKYVLPKFKLELKTEKNWYEPLALVKGHVQAAYFFGKPVEGEVTLKVSTFDVAFREFASLKVKCDPQGRAEFEFRLPEYFAGSPLEKGNARVQIEAEVMDKADHVEKTLRSVAVSSQPVKVSALAESGKLVPGVENRIHVFATSPDGAPLETPVTFEGRTSRTNAAGFASFALVPDTKKMRLNEAGVRVLDADVEAQGVKVRVAIPAEGAGDGVLLRLDKSIYEAGQTAKLDCYSSMKTGTVFLDVVKKGQTVLTTTAALKDGRASYALPLDPSLFGAIELHAYVLRPDGDVVRDTKIAYVHPAHSLKLDVSSDRPEYKPGEPCMISFRVADSDGRGRTAALGVIVVDESVYALQDMQPGLEKIYFTLEKELAQPRVEVCPGHTLAESIQSAKQEVAGMLLAGVEPRGKRWSVNPMAERQKKAAASLQKFYWALQNQAYGNPMKTIEKDVKTGKVAFRPEVMAELVKNGRNWGLTAEELKDPWGRALSLSDLGGMNSAFTPEYWERALNGQPMWNGWHQLQQRVAAGQPMDFEYGKDCFGAPLTLKRLAEIDPSFAKENLDRMALNMRKAGLFQELLKRGTSQDLVRKDAGGAWSWREFVLEGIAGERPEMKRLVGDFTLEALTKEQECWRPGNLAKLVNANRKSALFGAVIARLVQKGSDGVASFDSTEMKWTWRAGLLDELVADKALGQGHITDAAFLRFDFAALERENAAWKLGNVFRMALQQRMGQVYNQLQALGNSNPRKYRDAATGSYVFGPEDVDRIKEPVTDPWGERMRLVRHDKQRADGWWYFPRNELVSAGPDRKFDTADDIREAPVLQAVHYAADAGGAVAYIQDPGVKQPAYGGLDESDHNELGDVMLQKGGGRNRFGAELRRGFLAGDAGGMMPPAPAGAPMKEALLAGAKFEKPAEGKDPGRATAGGEDLAPAARVREFFPETLFWHPQIITNEDGTATLPIPMADSITTWRLTASANTADGLLGSASMGIRVFQDFFVEIDFPVALTQNDRVSVPVAIFNYLKEEQKIELRIEKAPWFELLDEEVKVVRMDAGQVKGVSYSIRVKGLGPQTLTVHARGTRLSDAVRRPVEIIPDGKMFETVLNDRLEAGLRHVFEIPENSIDGASKIMFKAYPGVFASVMDGLEGMLRMPGG